MQIKDRTFIVSGGSSGLGLATTVIFLQHGANVSILDLNPPPSDASLDPSRILFTKTNVASTESLQEALQNTLKWIQETTKPLSGVICSAGIGTAALALPRQDPSATHESVKYMDMTGFDRTLAINLRGTVDLIRFTVPHMALNKPWGPTASEGSWLLSRLWRHMKAKSVNWPTAQVRVLSAASSSRWPVSWARRLGFEY
ncbi:hypothetical protein CLAIMM_06339 [Cladophialophora immunda]|nr:hypothetical protein CLAIMM_06339 [Cladophialophora immunda]